jgi:DNA helicase TIP49 (TBP-interacting protein)
VLYAKKNHQAWRARTQARPSRHASLVVLPRAKKKSQKNAKQAFRRSIGVRIKEVCCQEQNAKPTSTTPSPHSLSSVVRVPKEKHHAGKTEALTQAFRRYIGLDAH